MSVDASRIEFLAGEARACAEGLWESQGPGEEPFRAEDADFTGLPSDVVDSLEIDFGRPLSTAEREAMEDAFHLRIKELLRSLIKNAGRILKKVEEAEAANIR